MGTSTGLKQKRKYAIVLAFVAAAVLTPPDPLSQVGLALPIILLYEISIISARLIERKRVEDDIDDEDWDDDDDDDLDDDGAVAELPGDPGDDNNG
jgi:sec-independent protein translocase protein TatC